MNIGGGGGAGNYNNAALTGDTFRGYTGGGIIYVHVAGTITINGVIDASGEYASPFNNGTIRDGGGGGNKII